MRLSRDFYKNDVVEVAESLLGKKLVREFEDGERFEDLVVEVEAYGGEEDMASHARFGKTERSEVMYDKGGLVYVYLIYGVHWMFNVVTGERGSPQAVLVRGTREVSGPGRLGDQLELDESFYGEDLVESGRIWFEEGEKVSEDDISRRTRVGVEYAGEWVMKKWRLIW